MRLDVAVQWLPAAFPAPACAALSSRLYDLELSHLSLVKAFHPSGSAESLAPVSTGLDWVCQYDACAKLAGHTAATTLHEAVATCRGPLSARVASSAHLAVQEAAGASSGADGATSTVSPVLHPAELHSFLGSLHAMTGRPWRDADVYLTKASSPSASLGWHVDDVDVLIVLLSGTKRCACCSRQSASVAPVHAKNILKQLSWRLIHRHMCVQRVTSQRPDQVSLAHASCPRAPYLVGDGAPYNGSRQHACFSSRWLALMTLMMSLGPLRFRVAGTTAGSHVLVDRDMGPGDAMYIPALSFHTGGCDSMSDDSMLMSVAMPPCTGDEAARQGVRAWRAARTAAVARLPTSTANRWAWAGSAEGARWLGDTLGRNPDWRRFCRVQPE
jgi:hypothetical protein